MNWISKLSKSIGLFLAAQTLSGCTTFDPKPAIQLPPGLHDRFEGCYPADGAMMLRIFENERLQASTELEWLAKKNGNWQADATTPFGQTLAGLLRKDRLITKRGQYADRLPEILINDEGFFEVDGNLVALKPDEVPCLLQNKVPRSWVPDLYDAQGRGDQSKLSFADGTRTIDLQLKAANAMCAELTWGHYGGLVTSVVMWCFDKSKGSLEGLGQTKLTWVLL